MKLYKYLAIALAAISATACSDDDSWNTASDVTVTMAQSTMAISEDAEAGRYYYLPVVVSGEANGPIQVTVEVKGTTSSPATEDKDYVVTQKTIVIPAGELSGNIEFYPTGDNEINDDRVFEATIVKAEGALIGSQATCTVTLKDNERLIPEAYANIQGVWNFKANTSRGPVEFPLTCIGANEGEDGYLTKLVFAGWQGYDWVETTANFSYDASTDQAIISFPLGQWVAEGIDFGEDVGNDCQVMLATVSYSAQGASLVSKGTIAATSDTEMTKIEFPESAELIGAIYFNGAFTGAVWFWYDTMSMSR